MGGLNKLALFGGTPIMTKPFSFNNGIGDDEKTAVMRVLDSGELSGFIASPDDYFWGGRKSGGWRRRFAITLAVSSPWDLIPRRRACMRRLRPWASGPAMR